MRLNSLKFKIILSSCLLLLLCIVSGKFVRKRAGKIIERRIAIGGQAKEAVGCDDFTKEEKVRAVWMRFFDESLRKKRGKKQILNFLRSEKAIVLGGKTHHEIRFDSADQGCYNKTIVFRLYFDNEIFQKYEYSYGVFAVD